MKKVTYFDPSAKKMKSRIYGATALILFVAMLLIDVANARGGTRYQAVILLIENIYLLVPWCVAYLFFACYRIFLKKFIPLYLCLALLVASTSQVIQDVRLRIKQRHIFNAESANIIQYAFNAQKVGPTIQYSELLAQQYILSLQQNGTGG